MTDAAGATITDRQDIADVFASFYADLYRRRHHDDQSPTTTNADDDTIQPFTEQELDKAISQLRNGRCRDTTGLIAEMLKEGGPTLRTHLLRLYNDVLQRFQTTTVPSPSYHYSTNSSHDFFTTD